MPAFYTTSETYSTPIDFPANPGDNDVFMHPGGWQYQYDAETSSWALVGSRGVEGPPGPQGPEGNKGPTGDKGVEGDKGPTGDKGATGNRGEKGPDGYGGVMAAQEVTSLPSTPTRGSIYLTSNNIIAVGV